MGTVGAGRIGQRVLQRLKVPIPALKAILAQVSDQVTLCIRCGMPRRAAFI